MDKDILLREHEDYINAFERVFHLADENEKLILKAKKEAYEIDFLKRVEEINNDSNNGFGNIIIIDGDKILLLKRSPNSKLKPSEWCTPGGHLENGENPLIGSIRELYEETGLQIIDKSRSAFWEYLLKGEKGEDIFYYIVNIENIKGGKNASIILDNNEHSNYQWCYYDYWNNLPLIFDLKEHLKEILGYANEDLSFEKYNTQNNLKKGGFPIGTVRNGMKKIADTGGSGDWVKVGETIQDKLNNITISEDEIDEYENNIVKPTIEQTWNAYEIFLNMVADGTTKSLVAFGTGGVGKTFLSNKVMAKHGLVEYNEAEMHNINEPEYFDYVKISGAASGSAVYQTLFEFNDKTIIFDDCDSVLKDGNAVNFFKGALDSSGDGTISYKTSTPMRTDKIEGSDVTPTGLHNVPGRFKFTGRVIFISNLSPEEIPQPLIDSRCLSVDLSMTKEQTIQRLNQILPAMDILNAKGESLNISIEEKEQALNFLSKYKDSIRVGKLNARTLGNIAKIIHSTRGMSNWEDSALTLLFN